MKRQAVEDERIVAQSRKIHSEALSLLMLVLLISLLVQQFLLDAPFAQYAVEYICFFGICVYLLARRLTLGLTVFGRTKNARPVIWLNSLVCGLTVAIINGVLSYGKYAQSYQQHSANFILVPAITFVSAALASFAALSLLNLLSKRRQQQLDKLLDDQEREE